MKKACCFLLTCFMAIAFTAKAQVETVDSIRFFTDEGLINMSLATDIRQLQSEKKQKLLPYPAHDAQFQK